MSNNRRRQSALAATCVSSIFMTLAAPSHALAQARTPATVDGVYVSGRLGCIGASKVQLSVVSAADNTLKALFSFYMPADPNHAFSYTLRGFYDAQKKALRLLPEKCAFRPS